MAEATTHVLFDYGGTVLSIAPFLKFIDTLAEKYSFVISDYDKDQIRETETVSTYITALFDRIEDMTESVKRRCIAEEIKNCYSIKKELDAGADTLIKHLHAKGIPMALATNYSRPVMLNSIEYFGDYFDRYFSHIVCGEDDADVEHNKPAPDVYFVAAKRFAFRPKTPQNVLIVEDSVRGITGAVKTGMKCLFINDCKYADLSSVRDGITCIAHTFADFAPESVGLPPYE